MPNKIQTPREKSAAASPRKAAAASPKRPAAAAHTRQPRSDGLANRAKLVQAALDLMGTHGVKSVTLTAVAKAAGITRAAAYGHFKSREELLAETKRLLSEDVIQGRIGDRYLSYADELASLASQDLSLLKSFVADLLQSGGRDNATLNVIIKRIKRYKKEGALKPGLDPVCTAMVTAAASYLGAILTVSRAKNDAERHQLARKFAFTIDSMFFRGLVEK
jgi:AcrR family transcriptional regulator